MLEPVVADDVSPQRIKPFAQTFLRDVPPDADHRLRGVLGEPAWHRLPCAVRRRFSKRIGPHDTILYQGHVLCTELSRAGRMLAYLSRLIGAPLPLTDGATGPAAVVVIQGRKPGEQCWIRTYARPGRAPQVIRSAKCFRGPTGLEEYVGGGIGMTLAVSERNGDLCFRSERYYFEALGWRYYIPRALEPGDMQIVHRNEADDAFSFHLSLTHPVLGPLLHQIACFHEPISAFVSREASRPAGLQVRSEAR